LSYLLLDLHIPIDSDDG
jgi:hypothetical protein